MASTFFWAGFAALAIALLFLIAIIQNSVDEKTIIPTPSIPQENGVMSSFASTKIKASVEEVFAVMASFKDYSTRTPFSAFNWKNKTADGVPMVGSTGSFRLTIDGYEYERKVQAKLTLLDRESKRIALFTTSFAPWLLASERVQEVVPVEGQPGYSEYRTWWTNKGVAAYYLLFAAKEDFEDSLKRSATDLRDLLERGRE
ncbi:hypothetical protein N431DRAFT_321990 [Stipitochalara longipes BDJ]|nr:hypothetical protein N431DRAFT_321990 [Stipitochalara longipes BDJ]